MSRFLKVFERLFVAGAIVFATTLALSQTYTPTNPVSAMLWCAKTIGGLADWKPCDSTVPLAVTGTVTVDTSTLATSAKQDTTNTDLGPPGATACATDTGSCSLNALLQRIAQRLTSLIGGFTSQYPSGAIPITASATGTTGATTATLAAHATKTTYICSFTITADATAVAVGTATITGIVTGTLSFRQAAQAAAAGTATLTVPFSPCVPGSAANTGLAVVSIAAGSGGNTAVSASGYQL